ncbi:hypothetical protein [Corynebacterium phoceense]
MKIASIPSPRLHEFGRIDAEYFLDDANALREMFRTTAGIELRELSSFANAYTPSRFKRTLAVEGEASVSYLRPYDVFEYLPPEADRLSANRIPNLEDCMIKEGELLQTCSGRNLGPVTIGDRYLSRFALSDDMIRIRVENSSERFYLLAFLRSKAGQTLLRNDRGGSVISHIRPAHVNALEIPFVADLFEEVSRLAQQGTRLREQARIQLKAAVEELDNRYPAQKAPLREGWTTTAAKLFNRLDAAYHAETTAVNREGLLTAGGERLGDVAAIVKPGGRHKMRYVEPQDGFPFLSGRQILQCDVVAGKYLSPKSAQALGGFELVENSVIFQSDGRAEESLGYPSFVTADRKGQLASGHVGRVVPFAPEDAGWIWASLASASVRDQVASLSCGSVVDALYPSDLEGVVLPPKSATDSTKVRDAWMSMSEGSALLKDASARLDEFIGA